MTLGRNTPTRLQIDIVRLRTVDRNSILNLAIITLYDPSSPVPVDVSTRNISLWQLTTIISRARLAPLSNQGVCMRAT